MVAPHVVSADVDRPDRTAYQYPVTRRLLSGDIHLREAMLLAPFVFLVVYIGIQPDGLTTRMNSTTNPLTSIVHPSTSPVVILKDNR